MRRSIWTRSRCKSLSNCGSAKIGGIFFFRIRNCNSSVGVGTDVTDTASLVASSKIASSSSLVSSSKIGSLSSWRPCVSCSLSTAASPCYLESAANRGAAAVGLRAGLFVDATRRRPLLIGTVIHLAFGFGRGSASLGTDAMAPVLVSPLGAGNSGAFAGSESVRSSAVG